MKDELKRLIKSQEPTFLPRARHKGYVCPVCLNGRGSDGDGILRTPGSDFYHCFKCGLHDDVFGLIGAYYNLPDFKEQSKKALEIYGINEGNADTKVTKVTLPESPETTYVVEEKEDPLVDQRDKYSVWNEAINIPGNPGLAYMQDRGFSLETLNYFGVGYTPKWKHPKTKNLEKVPYSPRVIIPTSPYSYLARDIRKPDTLKKSEAKFTKSKVGRVRLFNADVLETATETVFVVEGEIDAMSIYEVGGVAVGLGSASNGRVLVEEVKKHTPPAGIVLLPDNDEAGRASAAKLEEELKKCQVKVLTANIFGAYKDANEMLVKNREKLKAQIVDLKRVVVPPKNPRAEAIDKCNRALLSQLNLHERHKEVLLAHGLTEEQIVKNCYRSAPAEPKEVCKALKRMGVSFDDNPLFIKDADGEWTLAVPKSGLLVPVRSAKGRIQEFERISDQKDNDTYPITRAHFRRGVRGVSEVIVIGSAIRADITCALSGYSVLAVPSNFSEQQLERVLKSLQRRGLKKVCIAYNMSQENMAAQTRNYLCNLDIQHKTMRWDPKYDSLDRWLLHEKQKKETKMKQNR